MKWLIPLTLFCIGLALMLFNRARGHMPIPPLEFLGGFVLVFFSLVVAVVMLIWSGIAGEKPMNDYGLKD